MEARPGTGAGAVSAAARMLQSTTARMGRFFQLSNLEEYASSRLWIWPLAALFVTFGVAAATLYADAAIGTGVEQLFARFDVITGDPDAARDILSVIAGSMVSLLVFTFTMTMVVIQLASAQYSPRLTRSVLRDRPTKISLALFVCTFAYALIVLRSVVDEPGGRVVVPELSLAVTYVLVLASLFTFVIYINHIAHSMRVSSVITRVTDETLALIEARSARGKSLRADGGAAAAGERLRNAREIACRSGGALSHVDEDALVTMAARGDLVIELLPRVGDHVPTGATLVRVQGSDVDDGAILEAISLGPSRTMQQDIAYGVRQVVDIANRALSPGVNDPTTAVQCIDAVHDILRRLVDEPELPVALQDQGGTVRLLIPRATWADYVALATIEIRRYGASSPQVPRRLEAMLRDLHGAAPPERRPPLEEQLWRLESSVAREVDLPADRALMEQSDAQGLGGVTGQH